MTHTAPNHGAARTYSGVGMYGAGASEAADERLLEKVRARRLVSDQNKAKREAAAAQEAYTESAEGIKQQLAEVRARRQFLEEELKKNKAMEATLLRKAERVMEVKKTVLETQRVKAERERKRKAAFEGKKVAMAAKPTGITKPKKTEPKAMKEFRRFIEP